MRRRRRGRQGRRSCDGAAEAWWDRRGVTLAAVARPADSDREATVRIDGARRVTCGLEWTAVRR